MKYAVVTGSSRGIGAEVAKILGKQGYSVAICYNSNKEKAEEIAFHLAKQGVFAITVKLDLEDPECVRQGFEQVYKCFPRVDLLINNAAVDVIKPFEELSTIEWNKIVNVNLTGLFLTTREVCPRMRDTGGSIINVSSVWGSLGASCEVAYSASKAGVEGFTRALAKEYPSLNIYAVSIGYADTDMNADLSEEDIRDFLQEYPFVTRKSAEQVAQSIVNTLNQAVESGSTVKLW